jgi:cation-transporting ATPase F
LGLTLAFEPTELGIMSRPPRDNRQPILARSLIFRILMVGAIMTAGAFWIYDHIVEGGGSVVEARTTVVNVVVFTELFYLLNCRSLTRSPWAVGFFSNRWVIAGSLGMAALQVLITYVPLMNYWFETAPVTGLQWLKVLGISLFAYLFTDLEKRFQLWSSRRKA